MAALIGSVLVSSPADAAVPPPTLTLQTDDGIVRDDSVVSSGTTMTAAVGGLLEVGTGTRELRIDLDAATVYKAGGVTAPEGWTIEWSTDNGANWQATEPGTPADVTSVRASASVAAGEINGTSQSYTKDVTSPVPASTFSGSTGGDGWDVFFYDDFVLNIFHHQNGYVALDCHLRSTGARCAGYDPSQTTGAAHSRFTGYMAGNRSGGWVDGNTGRAYAFTAEVATNTPGVLCMDLNVAPPVNCGFTALSDSTNVSTYGSLSNADGVRGRLFGMESANQELLCFDPTTNAACVGSPISLTGSTDTNKYHIYPLGSQVFASTDQALYCFEASDLSSCGASWPRTYTALGWTAQNISPVAHLNSSGTLDGICMWNGCLNLAGAVQPTWVNPHSITPWSASASSNGSSGRYGRFTVTAGRAFLHEVLVGSGTNVYCFDYATEAACVGFDDTPTTDQSLYALVPDPNNPSCVWYNSDPGKIGLFDAFTGAAECTANPVISLLPSAFAPRFVCTTSGGIDRWTSLTLNSVAGGTPASQTLTVRTGDGDAVAGWIDRPVVIGETLSLADLAVADTGARPTFNITFSGVTGGALTSSDFTILYEGRGPELCVDYTVDNTAASGAPNCPVVQSVVGTLAQNVSGAVSEQTPSRSFTASGSATECPENITYAGPPGPVRDLQADLDTPFESTLTFKPPTDDGGSPVRWYEVTVDGGTTWQVITATPDTNGVVSHNLSPMPVGPATFEVRAVNQLGDGPDSDVSGAVVATPPTTAAPPTTVAPTTTAAPTTTTTASTTAPPRTSPPATSPPTVEPVLDSRGRAPDLDPGENEVSNGGVPVSVDVEVIDGEIIEMTSDDGVVLGLSGDCGGACPVRTGSDGQPYLVLEDTGKVRVHGEGFEPGSTVHVWSFPTRTYIGSATVNSSGEFDRSFAVDAAPGEHTLQVNGITQSGAERTANLGFVVEGGSGSGQLPNTGASMRYAYIGFALLAAGVVTIGALRVAGSVAEGRRDDVV